MEAADYLISKENATREFPDVRAASEVANSFVKSHRLNLLSDASHVQDDCQSNNWKEFMHRWLPQG